MRSGKAFRTSYEFDGTKSQMLGTHASHRKILCEPLSSRFMAACEVVTSRERRAQERLAALVGPRTLIDKAQVRAPAMRCQGQLAEAALDSRPVPEIASGRFGGGYLV